MKLGLVEEVNVNNEGERKIQISVDVLLDGIYDTVFQIVVIHKTTRTQNH